MPLLLSHLTLNTGYIARTGRAEVADEVVTLLLPVLDAGGGAVPGMPGWFLDVMFPMAPSGARLDGAAVFQVADEPGTSKWPVVVAVSAWHKDVAASAWEQAMARYRAQQRRLTHVLLWQEPPAASPPLPWLAVWLTPFFGLADAKTLEAFGDLERCVAWALIP